ncbi:unnamed protein product [Prorocentrum cordatum]|uniref:RanBP2-type domain-containing protein n=1 Tax=Prorocentrum cordatum TaxID=2364126 RepID=A0ABN9RJF7_9DINO|nr:unnamed protein product [Polarella glacialis]
MLQLERLSKVVLLLVPLLGGLWGGGLWYRRSTLSTAVSSTCQECLAEGQDFCISTNSCIPRATMGCRGPEDHITGDPDGKDFCISSARCIERATFGCDGAEDHITGDPDEHHHEHHGEHPGHSMVCPVPEQRVLPRGAGAREPRGCPCKHANARCTSASGEAAWEAALATEFGVEFAVGFGPGSAIESASVKLAGTAVFGEGTATEGHRMCPCGRAKKECVNPAGVKVLDGECAEKWEACAKQMRQKFLSPDSTDTKDGPCTEAKKKCWGHDGARSVEGECKELWTLCGKQVAQKAAAIVAENMGVESSTESGWERAKGWLGSMVSAVEAAPEESERDSGAAANAEQDEDPFAPYVRQMQGIPSPAWDVEPSSPERGHENARFFADGPGKLAGPEDEHIKGEPTKGEDHEEGSRPPEGARHARGQGRAQPGQGFLRAARLRGRGAASGVEVPPSAAELSTPEDASTAAPPEEAPEPMAPLERLAQDAPTEPPLAAPPLRPGARVRLAGLQSHPEMNGLPGTVVEARGDRWQIHVDGIGNRLLQVKNLERVEQAPQELDPWADDLRAGDVVQLAGMRKDPRLEGHVGVLVEEQEDGRWLVELEGEQAVALGAEHLARLEVDDDDEYGFEWDKDWEPAPCCLALAGGAGGEMNWDPHRSCLQFNVKLGDDSRDLPEQFQIFMNGDPAQQLYPDRERANPHDGGKVRGPDDRGAGRFWTIGDHPLDEAAAGAAYEVRLFIGRHGRGVKVDWVRVGETPFGAVEAKSSVRSSAPSGVDPCFGLHCYVMLNYSLGRTSTLRQQWQPPAGFDEVPSPGKLRERWACTGCKAQNGDGYDFCWKCWKGHDCAKSTHHGTTNTQDDTDADDATKARLKKQRGHLADLRRQAADPDLAPHVQGIISILHKEVDELQAAVETGSDVPCRFSECKLVRERNKTQGQRDRTKERVEKQELEIMQAQEKLDKDSALLARQEEKLQKQSTRIEEFSVPKPGQGWSAAVAFLEQASKCLRDKEADPKLSEGFITVNANSTGTLKRTMRSIRYTNKFPTIMAQELQAYEHSISCFKQRMQKEGWRLGIAPSVRTASGGWSAGALLATVRPNNMSYARGLDTWDISPRESKERLAIGWVDALGKQGITIGTAYLRVSEGMTDRNRAILRSFNTAAMAAGKHWILGGDFNMDPAELQQTGVINRMEGTTVLDTSRGSCVSSGEARHRDYFIISKTLLDATLPVAVQDQFNTAPHSPLLLRLPCIREQRRRVRALRHRRRWPLQLPTGCAAGPTAWPRLLGRERHSQEEVDIYWSDLANTYEEHLDRYFNDDGLKAWRRNGKQETPSWAQCNAKGILERDIIEPLLERRHPAWSGEADQEGAGEHYSVGTEDNADDLGEINEAARRVEEDWLSLPELTPRHPAVLGPGALQDCPLVGAEPAGERRLPTGRGHWTEIDWGKFANAIAWIDATNIRAGLAIRGVRGQAHDGRKPAHVEASATQSSKRLEAMGGQAQPGGGWCDTRVDHAASAMGAHQADRDLQPAGARATHPRVAADAALEGWETVWADSYDDSEPWRQPPSDDEWREHADPRITPRDVIEARGRFRTKTGLGEADWHPRLWRHGGFQEAARVAGVLSAVERGAPWPTTPATILFYLTPKAAGGFRNLGLIPELAREWETIRMPYARRWEAANQRAYDWARGGRSSERAAWLQALYGEAARAEGHEYAVTYFDLVKCFEWVTHHKVSEASQRWGFNPVIMRTLLKIYGMVRCIVLDGCYTEDRAWQRGIVAGSRYAPFCFKMVIILELDELVYQFP